MPIYLFLSKYSQNTNFKIILALGFSPVLLAILNVIIILMSIESSSLKYLVLIVPLLITRNHFRRVKIRIDSRLWQVLGLSLLIGGVYCVFAFPNVFYVSQQPYADVEFNLGLIQGLKHHFLPHDPYWRTEGFMIYHFLGNIFYAGLSNFTGLNVYTTYELGNVFLALNLFTIFGLIGKRKKILGNLIIPLVFFNFFVCQ